MTVTIARDNDIAVVTVDNPPVNAIGQAVRQGLWDAVAALDADPAVRAVVLTCAGRTFMAGADVREFGRPPQPPHLPDLVARIEAAAKPWVAAIHGSALGGGFEIALGCRWRVAAPDAQVGLPEVTLGIVPGAGGTVRTPRLIGAEGAVPLVTSGKPVKAARAVQMGLIDAVVTGDLTTGATAFLRGALAREWPLPISARPAADPGAVFWQQAAADVAKSARGADAPLAALESIRTAVTAGFDDAMAHERETFLRLRGSDQAAALRHVFFAERAAPRPPELEGVTPRNVASAAVIGGGTMGAGIAAALAGAGLPVTLIERDADALERGRANVTKIWDGSVKSGRMTEEGKALHLSRVTFATDYAALAGTDLVIEAVFEDMDVKRAVFGQLVAACRPDAILATNTSYLDPRRIVEGLPGQERFLGLHFFSPAHIMKLLEIVPTDATAPEVLAAGFALARRLGKVPVRAGICDGFIGNRILKLTRAQAERLLLAGATPGQVDGALRRFGMAMGPLQVQDLAGLDIAAFQRQAARARGETPFAPIADRLVEAGRLGQKTGAGWYDYPPEERGGKDSPAVAEAIAAAGGQPQALSDDDLVDTVILPMVDEGARILADGTAARAADVDLVKVHGYGFPRWRGGPMHWAERRGLAEAVARLDALAARDLAAPASDALRAAAARGLTCPALSRSGRAAHQKENRAGTRKASRPGSFPFALAAMTVSHPCRNGQS